MFFEKIKNKLITLTSLNHFYAPIYKETEMNFDEYRKLEDKRVYNQKYNQSWDCYPDNMSRDVELTHYKSFYNIIS